MRWPPPDDWPMAAFSRQMCHRPHRWHVQSAGRGDTVLLIHGAGGATQSWRALFPRLARSHHVVAVDLPGQGYSQSGAQQRFGLAATAEDLCALAAAEGWHPSITIGHSAGAAIALQMALSGFPTGRIGAINAALGNFQGVAGWLFPMLAKALAMTPLTAHLFSATANAATVHRLINGTGSEISPEGEAYYLRLLRDRAHVDATLSMMAQWTLDDLIAALPEIQTDVTLVAGENDKAVPPTISKTAAQQLPHARFHSLSQLGHLAHEEDPNAVLLALNLPIAPS